MAVAYIRVSTDDQKLGPEAQGLRSKRGRPAGASRWLPGTSIKACAPWRLSGIERLYLKL